MRIILDSLLSRLQSKTAIIVAIILAGSNELIAQSTVAAERKFIEAANESGGWWFSIVIILLGAAGFAFYFWKKKQPSIEKPNLAASDPYGSFEVPDTYEVDSTEIDRDSRWLRKKKVVPKSRRQISFNPKTGAGSMAKGGALDIETQAFQDKMRRAMFDRLPINAIGDLSHSKPVVPLPVSSDPALLSAIEQASDEFEDDEAVRELAVRVLAAFKMANSVEALTQIAIYDLSTTVRSMAVNVLADFDHPSVFEPILLACADPTREVKAAAARGLFRLSFDRADAWKRIMESGDKFRMIQAVRAASEAALTQRSFERLIHEDYKIAMESFALVALIIRSGETDELFETLRSHRDDRVKFAILHVLGVLHERRSIARLEQFLETTAISNDLSEKAQASLAQAQSVLA